MSFFLVFRRYAPFNEFGFGFEGDHRSGPSVSMAATARTIGIVAFDRGSIANVEASSSGTQFMGAGDHVRRLLGKHTSHVKCSISKKMISKPWISFTASTAGANPMLRGVAPDIDTFVDFRAEWFGTGVTFLGVVRGDDFPNAEVFVLDWQGVGCLLFDGRTTGGRNTGPMTRLAGAHESQVLGRFHCAIPLAGPSTFRQAKTGCLVTTMEFVKTQAQYGGGASGRW
jgi:hypothetical protein